MDLGTGDAAPRSDAGTSLEEDTDMPHRRSRSQQAVTMWVQPPPEPNLGADDPAPSATRTRPAVDLVDPRDPEFGRICHVLRLFQSYGFNVNDTHVVENAIRTARHWARTDRLEETRARIGYARLRGPVPPPMQAPSVVYYMRVGNRCKIGYTTDLNQRMAALTPEEVLAIEPGDMLLEGERHAQFDRLRTVGEWFRYEDELVDHVKALQARMAA